MLKRVFYILLSVVVLLSAFVLPASAYVVTEDNQRFVVGEALLTLEEDSLNRGSVVNLSYKTSNFTSSPSINYPFMGEYLYDPSGYTCFVYLPTSEYNANVFFYANFAQFGGSNFPGYDLTSTLEVGNYTVIYHTFTLLEYMRIFGSYQYPDVFNISCSSNYTGNFSLVNWGFCSNSAFKTFRNTIDSLTSYNNGLAEGRDIVSSLFTNSDLSMSYYFQGQWIDIPLTAPDLSSYVTASTVNLSLLQNLGLSADDIPTNNGGVRLTFTLPRFVDISGYAFGSFNPGDIIKRYDPADIRSERYGVWFNNTDTNISLWPGRNSTEDNMVRYEYFYSTTTNKYYNQVNIELNVNTLRNVLSSSTLINDYVTYNLIDYNESFDSGYEQGYDKGKLDGEAIGYETGKKVGYVQGKSDGINESNPQVFFGLFSALIDAPISAFTNLLSFEIFGQNMASFALSILTLLLIIKVVKVVI